MAKGSVFERAVCRQLSCWWSGDPDCGEDLFWRTSNSGGRATVRGRKGKRAAGHYGDITATDNRGAILLKFLALEVKRGYGFATVHELVDRGAKIPTYLTWIEQAELSRSLAKAFGYAIVHKRDRKETCIYFPRFVARKLMFADGPRGMAWSPNVPPIQVWYGPTQCLVGMPLVKFFDAVSPDDVRRAYREWRKK